MVDIIKEIKESVSSKITGFLKPKSDSYGEIAGQKRDLEELLTNLRKSSMDQKVLFDGYADIRNNLHDIIMKSGGLTTKVNEALAQGEKELQNTEEFKRKIIDMFSKFSHEMGLERISQLLH